MREIAKLIMCNAIWSTIDDHGLTVMLACRIYMQGTSEALPRVCKAHGMGTYIGLLRTKHKTHNGIPGGVPTMPPQIHRWDRQDASYTRTKDHLNLMNPLTAVEEHCAHKDHTLTKDSVIIITFVSYTEYNRTYQIQKCNTIEHNIKGNNRIQYRRHLERSHRNQNRTTCHEPRSGVRAPPHLRWTTAVMWSSSRRSHDLGGLASMPEEACDMHAKACQQAKKTDSESYNNVLE